MLLYSLKSCCLNEHIVTTYVHHVLELNKCVISITQLNHFLKYLTMAYESSVVHICVPKL